MVGKDDLRWTPAEASLLVTVLSDCTAAFIPLVLGAGKACVAFHIVQDEKACVWGLKKRTQSAFSK